MGEGYWCVCGGDWCVCLGMSHNAGSQVALSYTSKQKNARHGRATRSTASVSGLSPLLGLVLCQDPRVPTPLCPGELLGLWIKAGNKNPETFKFDLVFPYSEETRVTLQWLQWAASDQCVPAHRDGPDAQRPGE